VGGEAFALATGTKAIHVPYRGSSQAHIDIIGGQVEMMFDSTSSAMQQIKAGKFRPLAVAAAKRTPELPEVPTLAEEGIRGADVNTWYGLFVTAGTPRAAVERLGKELDQSLAMSDVQERIKSLGGEITPLGIEAFARMNRSEFERYGKLVKDAGIRAE
jgi:tripartite-type tricarboxylate transporter receptor subunit TctC